MLRVLSHYLPLRSSALFLSETLILVLIVGAGATQHLWGAFYGVAARDTLVHVRRDLARLSLSPEDALLRCLISSVLVALLAQLGMSFNGLYDLKISSSRYARAARFVEAAGTAVALTIGVVALTSWWGLEQVFDFPGLTLSQRVRTLVFALLIAFGALYVWRFAFHRILRKLGLTTRVLILGSQGPAHSLAKELLAHPDAGYEVAGLLQEPSGDEEVLAREAPGMEQAISADHEPTEQTSALLRAGIPIERWADKNLDVQMSSASEDNQTLLNYARSKRVDTIVVALLDRRQLLPTRELLQCRLAGVDIREREVLYEELTGRLAIEAMRPSYLIFNEGFQAQAWASLAKRVADIALSLLMLALLWPAMLLTAIWVRLDTPGPILFRQQRIGRDGKPFIIWKFRTMRADAEATTGPVWSSEDDPRITRSGSLMRKTRLDELPQLINVLRGSMSLVGPRPERKHFIDELAEVIPYYQQRHIVKPGVTGWAQINYPYGNTTEDALHKLQYDLFYVKNQSLLFDLSILFTTIKTVLLRKGT